jgi:hypothetical protein
MSDTHRARQKLVQSTVGAGPLLSDFAHRAVGIIPRGNMHMLDTPEMEELERRLAASRGGVQSSGINVMYTDRDMQRAQMMAAAEEGDLSAVRRAIEKQGFDVSAWAFVLWSVWVEASRWLAGGSGWILVAQAGRYLPTESWLAATAKRCEVHCSSSWQPR